MVYVPIGQAEYGVDPRARVADGIGGSLDAVGREDFVNEGGHRLVHGQYLAHERYDAARARGVALVPPGVGRGERGACMRQRCRQRLLHDMVGMAGRGMREAAMRAAKTEKRARGQVGMSDARTHLPSPSMPLYTKSDTMSCHENAAGRAPPTEAMPMAAAGMATRPGRCVQKKRADTSKALYKSEELLGRARCRVGVCGGGRGHAEQGRSGNRRDLGKKNSEHGLLLLGYSCLLPDDQTSLAEHHCAFSA